MKTDNNPDIILTLVAQCHRAHEVWADPHNESFYIRPLSQTNDRRLPEDDVKPDHVVREITPSSDDPHLIKATEPALRISFSKKPKNPELGYLLGSDHETCDIFLGSLADCISHQMYAISFNQYNEVTMKSSSGNRTLVTYREQQGTRNNFTWIFPPEEKNILVIAANTIKFSVEVPTHETDKSAYEANCRNFMKLADSASGTSNLLNLSSRPDTETSQTKAEPPFYLRTGRIGNGGFGVVYKARSMPDGGTVALKSYTSKNAWSLEADVLRKLSKTPHENIVQFLDFGLGNKPFLVMGLASEGNLEQQYRLLPFTAREVGAILRQMLNALVYLHVDFGITHRDVKPANILCDSRSHFRLADFGLAKEGDLLQSMKGTQPYMAPEMFTRKPYTAAVDLWGLGMVIAGLLTGNGPPGYKGNEGTRWCKAVVANFRRYEDCFQAIGSNSHEHFCLNSLVGQHMLKMEPEARESAPGCLDRGKFLWWMLDHHSDIGAETLTQEDPTRSLPRTPHTNDANGPPQENDSTEKKGGASGDNGLVRGMGPSGDNDSEAETEVSTNRTPISDDWASLERRFPNHDANGEGNEGKFNGPHNFARTSSADPIGHVPENPTTPSFNGHSKANAPQHNATANVRKGGSQGSRPASSAAPMGVQKPLHKHNKSTLSKSVAAAVAQQVAEEQPQNGEEISLDDYYKPGRPGHLLNPENRALIGAGETLEAWMMGDGVWPSQK